MRLAVLSESSADEAALRILVEGILGTKTELVDGPRLEGRRGWPAICDRALAPVLLHLYYQTDCEAFVVVADSNHSPLHADTHDVHNAESAKCRFCMLRAKIDHVTSHLSRVPDRDLIKTAVGVTVPAIEAWYLYGKDSRMRESAWARHLSGEPEPYAKNELKRLVYGTDRPPLQLATERAVEEAQRLAGCLPQLEERFPMGFGALANAIREW